MKLLEFDVSSSWFLLLTSQRHRIDISFVIGSVLGSNHLQPLSPSEEHLPFKVAAGTASPRLGTELLLIPRHVCPTVNLAETALLIQQNAMPQLVPVEGRAH